MTGRQLRGGERHDTDKLKRLTRVSRAERTDRGAGVGGGSSRGLREGKGGAGEDIGALDGVVTCGFLDRGSGIWGLGAGSNIRGALVGVVRSVWVPGGV